MNREYFKYKNGELFCENLKISKLIQKYKTPLYLYSESEFTKKINRYHNGFKNLNYTIFYAIKANSNLSILNKIKNLKCGVDLVSLGELKRAEKVGFEYEKIVFSGVGKTKEELMYALNLPLHSINIESIGEFKMILELSKKIKNAKKCPLSFRFNPDVNPKTHPYISTGLKENKFGLNRDEILSVLDFYVDELKKSKNKNILNISGLSVHIGSQIESLTPFKEAINKTLNLMEEIEKRTQIKLTKLDCGGGVGIPYEGHEKLTIESYGKMIQEIFLNKKNKKWKNLHLGFEPGRSIIGSSGVLVTKILFRKSRKNKDFLVVDSGMNDLMRPTLYQSFHDILPLLKKNDLDQKIKTDVVGPVCESSDFFAKNRLMSKKINTDDYLVILDTGAYGMSMSNQYNSRLRPAEVLVHRTKEKLIRKRDNYEDIMRGEKI